MNGDGLRDELVASFAAHFEAERGHPPEQMQVEDLIGFADAVLDKMQARIDAAREQVAEQIIEAIKVRREHWISLGEDLRYTAGLYEAVRIARQHAKGEQ